MYSEKKKKENLIRDEFELRLLKYAVKKSIPIMTVCRGFQFVNNYFGGSLKKIKDHVKTNHKIKVSQNFLILNKKTNLNTNSFHNYGIKKLPNNFKSVGKAEDNSVEIAYAKKEKILGLMFHPERKNLSQSIVNKLVFNYFNI